jgi:hypothetical protein
VIQNDEVSAKNFQELLNGLMGQATQLKTHFESENNHSQLDKIIADVKEYDKNFLAYIDIIKHKELATQQMNETSEEVLQKSFIIDNSQRQLLANSIGDIEKTINLKLDSESHIDKLVRLFMELRILQTNLLYEDNARQALSAESLSQQFLETIKKLRNNLQSIHHIDKLEVIEQTYQEYQKLYKNYIDKKNASPTKTKQPDDDEDFQNIEFSISEIMRNLHSLRNEQLADLKESISTTNSSADDRLEKLHLAHQISYYYLLARQQEALYFKNGESSHLMQVMSLLGKTLGFTHELISKFKKQTNIDLANDLVNAIKNYVIELNKYATLEYQQKQLDKQMNDSANLTIQNAKNILKNQEDMIMIEMKKKSFNYCHSRHCCDDHWRAFSNLDHTTHYNGFAK